MCASAYVRDGPLHFRAGTLIQRSTFQFAVSAAAAVLGTGFFVVGAVIGVKGVVKYNCQKFKTKIG